MPHGQKTKQNKTKQQQQQQQKPEIILQQIKQKPTKWSRLKKNLQKIKKRENYRLITPKYIYMPSIIWNIKFLCILK